MKLNFLLFKKILGACLFVFFAFGVFFGSDLLKNFKYIKDPQALNLLLYNKVIPRESLKEIESEYNLKINIDYADSLFDIEDKLKDPKAKYDIISIYSFQALDLNEEARLQPINWSLVKNLKNISSDFMNLGGAEISKKLLPLSWGVNGFAYDSKKMTDPIDSWAAAFSKLGPKDRFLLFDIPLSLYHLGLQYNQMKTKGTSKSLNSEQNLKALLSNLLKFSDLYHLGDQNIPDATNFTLIETSQIVESLKPSLDSYKFVIPKEGGLFWTLNLAEPRFAPHPKEVAIFLGAILEKKVALAILNFGHASTTSITLNTEPIDPRLKAQFIREIPLTKLKFQTSFSDSNLFSHLIDQVKKHTSE